MDDLPKQPPGMLLKPHKWWDKLPTTGGLFTGFSLSQVVRQISSINSIPSQTQAPLSRWSSKLPFRWDMWSLEGNSPPRQSYSLTFKSHAFWVNKLIDIHQSPTCNQKSDPLFSEIPPIFTVFFKHATWATPQNSDILLPRRSPSLVRCIPISPGWGKKRKKQWKLDWNDGETGPRYWTIWRVWWEKVHSQKFKMDTQNGHHLKPESPWFLSAHRFGVLSSR